jgi:hypothetical protein
MVNHEQAKDWCPGAPALRRADSGRRHLPLRFLDQPELLKEEGRLEVRMEIERGPDCFG